VQEFVTFSGRFDSVDQVDIRSRVAGYLDKIHFTDGAFVKKGDPLFTIDQRPYQAAVTQAEAALASSQASLAFTQADLERAQQLQKDRNISDQTADQRRQAYQQAVAQEAGNRAALEIARLNLQYTDIRAPIAGKISRKLVSVGNIVGNNDTLLTSLLSLDPIAFYFDLDENSYLTFLRSSGNASPRNAVGLKVMIATSDEGEPKRAAEIDFVDNRIDANSGTIRLRAKVPNSDLFLTPGLFGKVRLPAGAQAKGVLLPDEAIASDQSRRIVYAIGEDGSVTPRPVVLGTLVDGYRLIRSGLTGDETVAVNGIMRIRPGAKVTPQMTTLPPTRASAAAN
jgi:multidrug efflux system membrane fusion protein